MKAGFLILLSVALISCQESKTVVQQDSFLPRSLTIPDAQPDMTLAPDIRIIYPRYDASPPDAHVDLGPPEVCETYGSLEQCEIEGLLGPCAVGEKICYLTYWTPCSPRAFPREETCDAIDNDCDGKLNESPNNLGENHLDPQSATLSRACYTGRSGSQKFGPCRPGVSTCTEMTRDTDAGVEAYYDYGECEQQTLPVEENCDTIDNDCDGLVDEGVLNVCDACGPDPIEICDGETDEDCDGQVDEGLLNACNECGEVPRELCDFVDNDCDGNIDEDFENELCSCDHPDYVPQPEVCNGQDEDCDGFIDEGPEGGPLTKFCSTDNATGEMLLHDSREDGPQYVAGECRMGIAFCELGRDENGNMQRGYYECLQEVPPQVERCNEEDDDCDGIADEDFENGSVAVMMIVDVSGSMDDGELGAAFDATRNSVQRLFNNGILNVCYMLAVVGNDDMPDPYLFYPADNCVPGVEDPPVVPIEDMSNAVNTLMLNIRAGVVNQGGGTENTLDAIGRFFTDDRIDWDNDGVEENILWNTNRPQARIQGIEDAWDVDLSEYTHRIAIVIGDEEAQGAEWGNHDAARAMAHANGMVFIIGTAANRRSYQPLVDFGAVHTDGLSGFGPNNEQEIAEVVVEAIEEAACINNRQEEEQEAFFTPFRSDFYFASVSFPRIDFGLRMCL